ncbi:MAG: MarR family transcriptional regulator [Lysobacteraceae bacterium]|nr:MAG: MarR family transcriptional regulator [Xanthomonadaceae bacterium]
MDETHVSQVRSFNRHVTRRIGALGGDYLGRGRPLAESRLLFEIGAGGADVRELRERLALDSGYLSRLLRALEADGLVACVQSADDRRARRAMLTRKGVREHGVLDRRSQAFARSLLGSLLPAQRGRLVAAMAEVERCLRASSVEIDVEDPCNTDAAACFDAYFRELAARFDRGFDPVQAGAGSVTEYAPPHGVLLLARLDGQAVGCAALRASGRGIGEIKRMWVAAHARGLGIAQRMIEALEQHATGLGFHRLRLDTHHALTEARALYVRNGYREIERYNDNPYADHWFEKRVVRRSGARREVART